MAKNAGEKFRQGQHDIRGKAEERCAQAALEAIGRHAELLTMKHRKHTKEFCSDLPRPCPRPQFSTLIMRKIGLAKIRDGEKHKPMQDRLRPIRWCEEDETQYHDKRESEHPHQQPHEDGQRCAHVEEPCLACHLVSMLGRQIILPFRPRAFQLACLW